MDAEARKKALFRAKLNAQKKDKRIDSPLVRLVMEIQFFNFIFLNLFALFLMYEDGKFLHWNLHFLIYS